MVTIAEVEALLVSAEADGNHETMLRQLPPEDWPIVEAAGGRIHTTAFRGERPISRTYMVNRKALLRLREAVGSRDGDPATATHEEPSTATRVTEAECCRSRDFTAAEIAVETLSGTGERPETGPGDRPSDKTRLTAPGSKAPVIPDFDHGQNLESGVIEEISRAAGVLMDRPVVRLGDTLASDRDEAHEQCQALIWKLHRAGRLVGLYAGQVFSLIEERELWQGKAESFADYLRSDQFNPLGYDTARRLQRVYRAFCRERGLTPEQIHTVEVKKLDAIVAHDGRLKKAGQERLSNEEVVELVDEAKELTRADFQARLREIRGEEPMRIGTIEKLWLMYQSLDGQSRMEFKRGMQWIDSGKKRFEREAGWIDEER